MPNLTRLQSSPSYRFYKELVMFHITLPVKGRLLLLKQLNCFHPPAWFCYIILSNSANQTRRKRVFSVKCSVESAFLSSSTEASNLHHPSLSSGKRQGKRKASNLHLQQIDTHILLILTPWKRITRTCWMEVQLVGFFIMLALLVQLAGVGVGLAEYLLGQQQQSNGITKPILL